MQWRKQLRWKLFLSHLVIGGITVIVLLATVRFMTNVGLERDFLVHENATGPQKTIHPLSPELLLQRFQLAMGEALLVAALAAIEAAMVMSLFVSSRIVEPLQTLTNVSRRLAQGFYRERTMITSDDELAELSRSINQLAAALEQTEQHRMALLADVTHELRTPLATIEGYMEGLLDGMVAPNRQTFTLIQRESGRLLRLIEDLEILSRVEAGRVQLNLRLFDLQPLLETLILQFQPHSLASQIEILVLAPTTLPKVWADPDRVNQILINLLTNAFRYTPKEGKVLLRARDAEDHLVISVEDTGIGVAPEHLPHLFERFYRVDKSRARVSGGSGIGLTIACHLVYAQHGEIWAESEGPGCGTQFYFTLPLEAPTSPELRVPIRQTEDKKRKFSKPNLIAGWVDGWRKMASGRKE